MKSLITLGAVALCGSLIADVSSQNIVGLSFFKATKPMKTGVKAI